MKQYIPFLIGLYHFHVAWSEHKSNRLQRIISPSLRTYPPCYFIVFLLAVVLLFSLSIPAIGIYLGYLHEKKTICNSPWPNLFYAYCVVNFFRYFWSFTIRAGIVVATLRVREVWKKVTPLKSEPILATIDTSPHTQQTVLALEPNQNTTRTQETSMTQQPKAKTGPTKETAVTLELNEETRPTQE